MTQIKTALVLAAGEGSRIQAIHPFKPMVSILGVPLIDHMFQLLDSRVEHIVIALNSREKAMPFQNLRCAQSPKTEFIFVDTPSSMHTFYEATKRIFWSNSNEHIFVTMIDSILRPEDFCKFWEHCLNLSWEESTLLVTPFVDDDRPLFVKKDESGRVLSVGGASGQVITSGMYCFAKDALAELELSIKDGQQKMRTFLRQCVEKGYFFSSFQVEQSVDIDRPEDMEVAENFLRGSKSV